MSVVPDYRPCSHIPTSFHCIPYTFTDTTFISIPPPPPPPVVIGADTPLGRALAVHLSTLGFIVIVSVSSQSALAAFNSIIPPSSRGYMKALLFETSDVASSLGKFVRSVDEVLKLRFPLLSAGDPYAAPGDEVTLVATINALSYVAAPTEHNLTVGAVSSFQSHPEELAEALERHVVASLCALSALQPLLTAAPPRGSYKASADSANPSEAMPSAATALTLLSSPSSHTSLPGAGRESVVAQAVAAGMETLRREAEDRAGRESTLTLPGAASKRTLRVTTVEIDEGLPWGYSRSNVAAERQGKAEGEGLDASTAAIPTRPSFNRRSSSALWPVRDTSTQLVLSKISTILLGTRPSSRLKSRYRVYLPTEGDNTLSGKVRRVVNRTTQRLMTVIPTSWVDVLLALRRHVSLRRAGLIAQGPRSTRAPSAPGQPPVSAGSRDAGRPPAGPGSSPGPASPAHSRRFANARSHAQAAASGSSPLRQGPLARPESISASSDDGEGYYGTSGPPSLPDSNSEESHADADAETEDGMLSSGMLSNPSSHEHEHDGEGGGGAHVRRTHYAPRGAERSESTASGDRTASNSLSNSAFSSSDAGGNGPWVGPESRESPRAGSPLSGSASAAGVDSQGSAEASVADVSDSWVRLGESQRLQKDGE